MRRKLAFVVVLLALAGCDKNAVVIGDSGTAELWITHCHRVGTGVTTQVAIRNLDSDRHHYVIEVEVTNRGQHLTRLTGRTSVAVNPREYGVIDLGDSGPFSRRIQPACAVASAGRIN